MGKLRAWVLNGPNLNLLGSREPEVYGRTTHDELVQSVARWGEELGVDVECFQSNHEGALLDRLHEAPGRVDFLVLNPGALTHTSLALRDAISAVGVPAFEVHLSNIHAREEWRHHSWIAGVCRGSITGLGPLGYRLALEAGRALCDPGHSRQP